MRRHLEDPTPGNKARLKPSDLAARDTFTGETMKLEEPRKKKEKNDHEKE